MPYGDRYFRGPQTGRYRSDRPNRANTPRSMPRAKKPKGPAAKAPKTPKSGKECRRMMKATAYRLSRLVHLSAKTLYTAADPLQLVYERLPNGTEHRGVAAALARKIRRLQIWYAGPRDAKP